MVHKQQNCQKKFTLFYGCLVLFLVKNSKWIKSQQLKSVNFLPLATHPFLFPLPVFLPDLKRVKSSFSCPEGRFQISAEYESLNKGIHFTV